MLHSTYGGLCMNKYYAYYHSPIGVLELVSDEENLLSVLFVDEEGTGDKMPEVLVKAYAEFDAYFKGECDAFTVPIKLQGTDFQQRVWQELCNIPFGEVISYKELAKRIGNIKAVRAVGTANSKNVISILVPCHRVIGANGKLTGYAGGLDRKEWLINHERRGAKE